MTEPHALLNALSDDDAKQALLRCCKSTRWVEGMLARRPFASAPSLYATADDVWAHLGTHDYLEAFAGHPKIGANLDELAAKYKSTATWSASEQGAVATADTKTLEALRDRNVAYEQRFGFIFIVCATGKSAKEMLTLLQARLGNERGVELRIAAGEQAKITKIRLEKLSA